MSCPRARTKTKRVCCDEWNRTLGQHVDFYMKEELNEFENMAKISHYASTLCKWIAKFALFCPYCGERVRIIQEESYPCDTGCFDRYDGDESPNIHNDMWGSQGPDCLPVPLAAVGV